MAEVKTDEKKICDNIQNIANFLNNFHLINITGQGDPKLNQMEVQKNLAKLLYEYSIALHNYYAKQQQQTTQNKPKTHIDVSTSELSPINSQTNLHANKFSIPDLTPKTDIPHAKKETQVLPNTNPVLPKINPINDLIEVLTQNLDFTQIDELNKFFTTEVVFKDLKMNSNLKLPNEKFSKIYEKITNLNINIPTLSFCDALSFKMDDKDKSTNSSFFYLLFMYYKKIENSEYKSTGSEYLDFITKFTNLSISLIKTNILNYRVSNPSLDVREICTNPKYPIYYIKKMQRFVLEDYLKSNPDYHIISVDSINPNIKSFTNFLLSRDLHKEKQLDSNPPFAICLDLDNFDVIKNNDAYNPLVSLNCGLKWSVSSSVSYKLKMYLLGKMN